MNSFVRYSVNYTYAKSSIIKASDNFIWIQDMLFFCGPYERKIANFTGKREYEEMRIKMVKS